MRHNWSLLTFNFVGTNILNCTGCGLVKKMWEVRKGGLGQCSNKVEIRAIAKLLSKSLGIPCEYMDKEQLEKYRIENGYDENWDKKETTTE